MSCSFASSAASLKAAGTLSAKTGTTDALSSAGKAMGMHPAPNAVRSAARVLRKSVLSLSRPVTTTTRETTPVCLKHFQARRVPTWTPPEASTTSSPESAARQAERSCP